MLQSARNGYAKYLKLKTPASQHSSQVAKEMIGNIREHPVFGLKGGPRATEEEEDILKGIRMYKPRLSSRMAFVNPYSHEMQHMIEYMKVHNSEAAKALIPKRLREDSQPIQEQAHVEMGAEDREEKKEVHSKEAQREGKQNNEKTEVDRGEQQKEDPKKGEQQQEEEQPQEDREKGVSKKKEQRKRWKAGKGEAGHQGKKGKQRTDYKDEANYISFEPTRSQEKLRRVNRYYETSSYGEEKSQ